MAEEKQNTINAEQPQGLMLHSQYIKDLSLELPFAPEIFKELGKQNPQVGIDINIANKPLEDDMYEVSLTVKVNADVADKKLFILEVTYATLATVKVPAEHLEPVLYIELPRLLFPFVRNIVATNLTEAGLPPMLITPIDFVALYQARKAKEAENAAKAEKTKA
ncbi:MAG: protein-export chaperone SecB [Alphaproteobacteria bacterium]|nr:protein-export chaperone SecB [Alphaproteobacteria bacterium]